VSNCGICGSQVPDGAIMCFRCAAIDWESEYRKRAQWNEDNGYWTSSRGGCDIHCGKCVHRKDGRCEIIPSLVNRVDLFSGCRLKEVTDEVAAGT
jgi:hypothetical protein